MADRSEPGHIGSPAVATAEKGEALLMSFAEGVASFLERVVNWNGACMGSVKPSRARLVMGHLWRVAAGDTAELHGSTGTRGDPANAQAAISSDGKSSRDDRRLFRLSRSLSAHFSLAGWPTASGRVFSIPPYSPAGPFAGDRHRAAPVSPGRLRGWNRSTTLPGTGVYRWLLLCRIALGDV